MGDDEEQQWLADRGMDKNPRVIDQLKPAVGWETAVETVLGSYLQAVSVTDMKSAVGLMQDFTKGELLFVSAENTEQSSIKGAGKCLSDFVDGAENLPMLSTVYVADSLVEALALQSQLLDHQSVVTADGIWLGPNWARVARDKDATAGVLQRKQELIEIQQQLSSIQTSIDSLEARRKINDDELVAREQQRQDIAARIEQQQGDYAELRSKYSAFEVQIEQFKARRARAESELETVNEQIQVEQSNINEARSILQASIEAMQTDTLRRDTLLSQRDQLRVTLDEARQEADKARDSHQQLALRESSLGAQISSIDEAITRLEPQLERLEQRRDELRLAYDIKEDPTEDYQSQLEEKLAQRLAAETELAEARKQVEKVEYDSRQEEKRRSVLDTDLQKLQGELENQRLSAKEIGTLQGTLERQIAEQQGSLDTLCENLDDDADLVDWEEQLQLMANRITRLGPINLAAIDEYAIESERKEYLDKQNDELEEALSTLQSAIHKIDRETRTRFKETFELVNTHIQALFPKLFGGGHAYLEMTGEDLLNTGVTLMARPPGKKNSSIHLLSGGEKALTAIAMVFAIFKLNPAPFCMLDEVDAPLDDANVGRYAAMVKEMSDQVQFIFITHNKISMEAANQLMGVTMHEAGVSRLVSVDVDQAAELADA